MLFLWLVPTLGHKKKFYIDTSANIHTFLAAIPRVVIKHMTKICNQDSRIFYSFNNKLYCLT